MNKTKERVVWQHFGFNGELERETATIQNVYHRKNGTHYCSHIGYPRTVKFENGRYIAFGSKKCGMTKMWNHQIVVKN